jgi:LemA protein
MAPVFILLGIVAVLVLWFVAIYNNLVHLRNYVDNAWAQIDVQLKRRHDLIPNLIETVKGYMTHERDTLEAITKARTAAMGAKGPAEAGPAETALSGALRGLMVNVERYPDLKASQNFLALQEELSSPRTKSPSRARPTTTASRATTPASRPSPPTSSPDPPASRRANSSNHRRSRTRRPKVSFA